MTRINSQEYFKSKNYTAHKNKELEALWLIRNKKNNKIFAEVTKVNNEWAIVITDWVNVFNKETLSELSEILSHVSGAADKSKK